MKNKKQPHEEIFVNKGLYKDVQDHLYFSQNGLALPLESIDLSDIDQKNTLRYADKHNKIKKFTGKKEYKNTHLGYDFANEEREAETDFYMSFAERPLLTSYEYRYIPIILYIFFSSQYANSFNTFNYYTFSRLLYTFKKYPLTPVFREYSDPQVFFHEVLK